MTSIRGWLFIIETTEISFIIRLSVAGHPQSNSLFVAGTSEMMGRLRGNFRQKEWDSNANNDTSSFNDYFLLINVIEMVLIIDMTSPHMVQPYLHDDPTNMKSSYPNPFSTISYPRLKIILLLTWKWFQYTILRGITTPPMLEHNGFHNYISFITLYLEPFMSFKMWHTFTSFFHEDPKPSFLPTDLEYCITFLICHQPFRCPNLPPIESIWKHRSSWYRTPSSSGSLCQQSWWWPCIMKPMFSMQSTIELDFL